MSDAKAIDLKRYKNNRVDTPTIFQMEATECGAASLAMVLAYFGRHVSLEQMRIDCGISKNGSTAKYLLRAARAHGLEAHGYSKSVESLLKLDPPCIIHWNFNHFVVYEGIKAGRIYLNDPAHGKRVLTFEELDSGFTGVVISFRRGADFVPIKKKDQVFRILREKLVPHFGAVAGLVIVGLILMAVGIVIPAFSKAFIDNILLGGNAGWIVAFIAMFGFVILFRAFFSYLKSYTLTKLKMVLKLTEGYKFLNHMFQLPVNFYEQRQAGDLVRRMNSNINVNRYITDDMTSTLLNFLIAAFYLVMMLLYSPLLTVTILIGFLFNYLISIRTSKRIEEVATKRTQDSGKLSGAFFAGVKIISTLKATGSENDFTGRLLGYYAKSAVSEQDIARTSLMLSSIPAVFSQVINIAVTMLGGIQVIEGKMSLGELTAFLSLQAAFSVPLNGLAGFIASSQMIKSDIARVNDIMDYREAPQYGETKAAMTEKLSGRIDFTDVTFGYSRLAPPLIEKFSFHVEPGKSIALVGATGSGKSTVGKLISGLNDAWEGEILFDGVPIRKIPVEIFSQSVATVSQSITVFSDTFRNNLTLWDESVKDKELYEATRDARIFEMIAKREEGFNGTVSEGGNTMSGGQRQRLEIARALVKNPSIIVLDEATSALDAITEKEVMDNIRKRGCTSIIIAHRLSTIRDCDEIILLEDGKPVERGTHEELKALNGKYAELIKTMSK